MAWSNKLTQLNDALGGLIPNKNGIAKYIDSSGLKQQFIDTDGTALDVWNSVLNEADKQGKVNNLVRAVMEHYPDNPFLTSALKPIEVNYSLSPDIDKISEWQPLADDTLEVLTMGDRSMLPISFLELGVIKSKSVAKLEIRIGTAKVDVGTGFLFKVEGIDDLLFMTNHHVINSTAMIKKTRVIFNYELDIKGDSRQSKSFEIDPVGPWYTSTVSECDVTVFKIKATDNELVEFGHLSLSKAVVERNDFVNIIQHPGGEMKQISLYHNIVTNTDERVIQYLTDTLKGSSGAPVFNSDWQVVALHHSGGDRKNGEPELPFGFKSRNEGIQINKIIDFITTSYKKK